MVLEPLEFVLPKKEPVTSVLGLSTELNSLTTAESDFSSTVKPEERFTEEPVPSEHTEKPESTPDAQDISVEAVTQESDSTLQAKDFTEDLSTTDVNVEC